MGRKNFNRRGKMGRRARTRRTLLSSAVTGIKKHSKFDAPPRKGDGSVVSSVKRKVLPGDRAGSDDEPEEEVDQETPIQPAPAPLSRKQRHAEERRAGDERKKKLRDIQKSFGVEKASVVMKKEKPIKAALSSSECAVPAVDQTSSQTPTASEAVRRKRKAREERVKAKMQKQEDSEDEAKDTNKPKFGEVIERPSEKIAALGKALSEKFKPEIRQKFIQAAEETKKKTKPLELNPKIKRKSIQGKDW